MRSHLIRRNGFTLIEALVAFAILALVMAQLLSTAGGAALNESRADFLLRASRMGQSHLDALGIASPIAIGETSGRYDDGLLWSLIVEPGRAVSKSTGASVVASYWARLTISRPTPRGAKPESLTLTTLKLVTTANPAR
ncbi:MAG: prepilin-type N-terminal cleavage/methylation domain-containing protein [Roseiarcus sp.]